MSRCWLPFRVSPGVVGRFASLLCLTLATQAEAQDSASPTESPGYKTEVAFPSIGFDRPVAMAHPDDGSQLLFVVEQHQAKIYSFTNTRETSDKQLFLELPDPICKENEEGLLGLTFHPRYKENGEFFVYYSSPEGRTNRRSVVSRFTVSKDNPRKADPKSEKRIWVGPEDPFWNHNGGCIEFGPDGFLYISLGDSGAADDPLNSGQNPKDLFASILRIDVDHPADGKAYGIPADNPSKRDTMYAHWAARGLRHRIAERLEVHV